MTSLTRSALSGAAWNYAGAAVLVVSQIASTAVTARLIAPAEFGVYATAQAAAGIFGYFTLSAVGQGLLRRSELGAGTVGSATVITLASSGVLALVMFFIAGPWSDAWGVPAATRLIRVIALTLFLTGCSTVPLALLRRNLRYGTAAVVETSTQVIGTTIGVLLAISMHSALALVIGQTVAAGTLVAAATTLARSELRFDFVVAEARPLLSFAGQVSALNIGFFTLYTAPSWVIARLFGAHSLGLYSRASLIVGLPLTYLSTGLAKVMYPLFGRVGSQAWRARALLNEAVTIATGFVWTLFALIAGAAPVVVEVLLGRNWHGAVDLLQFCALIACGNLPWALLANAAEAFGWMGAVWLRQAAYLLILVGAIVAVDVAKLDVEELLVGVAAAQWIAYFLLVGAFVQRGFLERRLIVTGHAIHGALALCAYAGAALCAHFLHGPLFLRAAGEIAVGLAVCGALVIGRFRIPCSRVLGERLALAATGERSRLLDRLGFRAPA